MTNELALWLALGAAIVAVIYGLLTTTWVLGKDAGNEKMQKIAAAVQEGAKAYMNRQYSTIGLVGAVLFVVVGAALDWATAVGFAIGAVFSALAGYIGMFVSVRANVRTAQAAREGVSPALKVAFRGGAITGMLVVGLGLLGVAGYFAALQSLGFSEDDTLHALVGLAFGGSLISIFARLGGGIFTKGADVGADLVGKVEAGIPEDDPRNPGVIADNVGDNVGDVAGMGADLYESYCGSILATAALGVAAFASPTLLRGTGMESLEAQMRALFLPLAIAGIGIFLSIAGMYMVRTEEGATQKNLLAALARGINLSCLLIVVAAFILAFWLMPRTQGTMTLDLVPGVAFSTSGARLGRGKGFYDRFLKNLPKRVRKIGLAYDLQIIDSLPIDPHDIPVDIVITNLKH